MEESEDQSDEDERGGADATGRGGEGLCVFEHPVLLIREPLFVQLRAHYLPNGLVVTVEPVQLKRGVRGILTEAGNLFLS